MSCSTLISLPSALNSVATDAVIPKADTDGSLIAFTNCCATSAVVVRPFIPTVPLATEVEVSSGLKNHNQLRLPQRNR